MPALPELQARFYAGIVGDVQAEDALLDCLVERGETGRRRIAAYRRSILGNLVGALLATYPVLARIVGLPFFREAARGYVRTHPSASGDLNEYGGEFADFIAAWQPADELAYLPDVARLEWRVQQVYYAADAVADLSVLAACPPQDYGTLRFELAPACARMDSAWPLDAIWRVNAEDYRGDMSVDFTRGSRLVLLRRDGLVHVESLTAGEAAFLDALAAADNLDTATAKAVATDAAFDLGAVLARCVGNGAIVRARLPAASAGERT
jgi:hypothetical protein